MSGSRSDEARLTALMASVSNDPLMFVHIAFPWGEPGTELEHHTGPDVWQTKILAELRDGLKTSTTAIQEAVASGHGVGKSALVSWICLWALATMPDCMGVVTANTETQLRTKTWAQLSRWARLCICSHWFTVTATAIYSVDPTRERTWRVDAIPWSEARPEATAGLHNQGKRVLLLMDEASAIPDIVWETAEGALTDANTQIIWCVFGNPTRNSGRFRECFGRFRHRWNTHQIDARTAKMANREQAQKWIEDYGDDSDFVRVRVKGVFPRAGSMQFIGSDIVEAAMSPDRDVQATVFDSLILGVDVARFGSDMSCLYFRRGRDGRSIPPQKYRQIDTMALAAQISVAYETHRPDAIMIDGGGVGGGVVDRCRQMGLPVYEVQFGARATEGRDVGDGTHQFYNFRAMIWHALKIWLEHGVLPYDPELLADLTGVEYGYRSLAGTDALLLERKADMIKRGLSSPDIGDALALTFSYVIQPKDHTAIITGRSKQGFESSYSPMAEAWAAPERQSATTTREHWLPGSIRPLQ